MEHIETNNNPTEFIHSMKYVNRDCNKNKEKRNKKKKLHKDLEEMKNKKLVHDLTENKGGMIDVLIG